MGFVLGSARPNEIMGGARCIGGCWNFKFGVLTQEPGNREVKKVGRTLGVHGRSTKKPGRGHRGTGERNSGAHSRLHFNKKS